MFGIARKICTGVLDLIAMWVIEAFVVAVSIMVGYMIVSGTIVAVPVAFATCCLVVWVE